MLQRWLNYFTSQPFQVCYWEFIKNLSVLLVQHTSPGLLGEDHSLCDGSGVTYIHLQLHNRSIFEKKKKNHSNGRFGSFLCPSERKWGSKGSSSDCTLYNRYKPLKFHAGTLFFYGKLDEDNRFSQFSKFDPFVGK